MKKHIIIIIIIFIILFIISKNSDKVQENWENELTFIDKQIRNKNNCEAIKIINKMDYNIKVVPNSCEDGLPHTIDMNTIVIPENIDINDTRLINHEKVHLDQRRNINKWIDFYKTYWHYTLHRNPPKNMPKELIEMRRSNPDTDGYPWVCWKDNYWSVPIYIKSDEPKLYRIKMKWWNMKSNIIDDNPPKEWTEFFGNDNPQNEHPHELSAVYISNYIEYKKITSKAMEKLLNVFNYIK